MGATYSLFCGITRLLGYGVFSFRVVHPERIIERGGALLAMNHQSYFDPPLLAICCRREVYFLTRRELFQWPVIGKILPKLNTIPVAPGRTDTKALRLIVRLVKAGECVCVFPEGARTLDGNLRRARPGLGLVIARTLAPVVPMRIFGAHEAYARGRRFPRPHPITIVVGEPIHFTQADLTGRGRELYQALATRVMEGIAAIRLER